MAPNLVSNLVPADGVSTLASSPQTPATRQQPAASSQAAETITTDEIQSPAHIAHAQPSCTITSGAWYYNICLTFDCPPQHNVTSSNPLQQAEQVCQAGEILRSVSAGECKYALCSEAMTILKL